jgi:lysophospholipase L1-like esterase
MALGMVVLVLGGLELLARGGLAWTRRGTEGPPPAEDAMQPSALLGWAPRPGRSRGFGVPGGTWIDAYGTRNPEPEPPRGPGELRLLTIGDSTVYGVMVADDEVFSAVAARDLTRRLGRPVHARNGGVPGYSSEQALRLLEGPLADVSFDVLVIATQWSDSQLGPAPDAQMWPRARAGVGGLLSRSGLFQVLALLVRGAEDPEVITWRLSDVDGVRRVPPGAYRRNLRALAALARDRGALPAFLVLPSDRDLRGQPLEPPRPAYREMLRAAAAEAAAPLIDGATPFAGGNRQLMADDVHPSRGGHRLLGEALAAGLEPHLRDR